MDAEHEALVRQKFEALAGVLDETGRRLWAAVEARAIGHGGIAQVARATGLARMTIVTGLRELETPAALTHPAHGRVRRPGGGRKSLTTRQPKLAAALERLVAPATRGDPQSALRWTSKSTGKLAAELRTLGFDISADTVGVLLKDQGYSLQATRKTQEGRQHPDRDAQFQHIAAQTQRFQRALQPVISVDCKKKELIGDFKNGGREWQPLGRPEAVNVYDFVTDAVCKVNPYGVYDVTRNEAWVSVGTDHDTAAFAVNTIRRWWRTMGRARYPDATQLYITADGGGSNGARSRLWKQQLQHLADGTGLTIHVSHLPPGTSKWNKIEHRLFGQITMNWRGKPLTTVETVVRLIANTTTQTGLKVRAAVDAKAYRVGRKISDAEMSSLALIKGDVYSRWNYSLTPRIKPSAN